MKKLIDHYVNKLNKKFNDEDAPWELVKKVKN